VRVESKRQELPTKDVLLPPSFLLQDGRVKGHPVLINRAVLKFHKLRRSSSRKSLGTPQRRPEFQVWSCCPQRGPRRGEGEGHSGRVDTDQVCEARCPAVGKNEVSVVAAMAPWQRQRETMQCLDVKYGVLSCPSGPPPRLSLGCPRSGLTLTLEEQRPGTEGTECRPL
jgi:hypothetical protein